MVYIIAGVRPSRPQGTQGSWFTDAAWDILELSWRKGPDERPHLHAVLRCLQDATRPAKTISGTDGDILPLTDVVAAQMIMRFLEVAQSDKKLLVPAYSSSSVESTVNPQGDDQLPARMSKGLLGGWHALSWECSSLK